MEQVYALQEEKPTFDIHVLITQGTFERASQGATGDHPSSMENAQKE